MASLPAQHPSLTLHLTDRALTPILSSASASASASASTSTSTPRRPPHTTPNGPRPKPRRPGQSGTAARSPAAPLDQPGPGHGHGQEEEEEEEEEGGDESARLGALRYLGATLAAAHDLAAHLGHGPAKRIMVETAGSMQRQCRPGGPVVLGAFLDGDVPEPAATGLGRAAHGIGIDMSGPGTLGPKTRSRNDNLARNESPHLPQDGSTNTRAALGPNDGAIAPPRNASAAAPPSLIGLVLTRSSKDADEARWAAAQLEEVGRHFQAAWLEDSKPRTGEGE
jgi:hypothetical protein